MAWTGVITNAGTALIAGWAKGDAPIELTRAAGGDSTYPVASLLAQTALGHAVQEAEIVQKKDLESGQEIKLQFPAHTEAYLLRQIGIFAGETLLALFQNDSGVAIQSTAENPNFLFSFFAVLDVSNETDFHVTVSPGASVTMEILEDALRGKADLENGKIPYDQLPVMDSASLKQYIGI